MIPTTIFCHEYSMEHSVHEYHRPESKSLHEEVSSEDLEQLKNIVKNIRQDPNLLSQVFPTIPNNIMLDKNGGSDNSFCSSERQDEKESWFLSIDAIRN
jgi:hypothetical protein